MNFIVASESALFDSWVFSLIVVPVLIFGARILDVSIGSIRVIFLARGKKLAALLGFFEVLIWLVVITQIMQNLNNPISYIAYAAGFAMGTLVGIHLEGKMALGTLLVRVITGRDADELVDHLRSAGYGVTSVDAHGVGGRVQLIYTIIQRKNLRDVIDIITARHPKAFLSVEEVQLASQGVFPVSAARRSMLSRVVGRRHKTK